MKVGDYIRIHTLSGQGGIAKLEKIDDICITDNGAVDKNNIIKSSPDIIDLIQVGDYVNGYKVLNIRTFHSFDWGCDIKTIDLTSGYVDNEEDIKSIITKEQFESMVYKVGESDESKRNV